MAAAAEKNYFVAFMFFVVFVVIIVFDIFIVFHYCDLLV
jgi:hypothetical protein